jgi:protein-L-isoaspartate(D-aspartate) O-methyltransferase
MMTREGLLTHLEVETGVLDNPLIKKAFENVDRQNFVDGDYKVEAYEDYALPLAHGQTISQPTTIAFMLELLDAEVGHTVLEVGTGSGFTSALLSDIVGEDGKVISTEIIPELKEKAIQNLKSQNIHNVTIIATQQGTVGYSKGGKYDRILVHAGAEELPEQLVQQLKIGGVLVVPIKESVYKIVKKSESEFEEKEYPGFSFVPLS